MLHFKPIEAPGIGHNQPSPYAQVIDPAWGESIHDYPDKYRACIADNEKLNLCCRKVDQLKCSIHKTPTCDPSFPYDLFIAVCGCGRKHRRLIVGLKYTFVRKR